MSQSPVNAQPGQAPHEYLRNWDALGAMIRRGRTFSGYERNCAFLNTGDERWANVSAATGLDLIDDGRGVALTDWDRDGDLDLWISNRNAPQVRFLRNDIQTKNHFLAFRLEGRTCNRDAIGARIEVHLGNKDPQNLSLNSAERLPRPGDSSAGGRVGIGTKTLINTLRAGEGFVSQSSKTIHFGLGRSTDVKKVVVRWPGAASPETITGVEPDRHYKIVQGSGRAEAISLPPRSEPLEPSKPTLPPPTDRARIVVTYRRVVPTTMYEDLQGSRHALTRHEGAPLLVNLWSSSCAPCLTELTELAEHASELQSKNLTVLALCTDLLTPGHTGGLRAAESFIARSKLPFSTGVALEETVKQLTEFQSQILYKERPLPLPTSFLIDRLGQIAVIYRGPVTSQQLLSDLQLLDAPPETVEAAAFAFPGRNGIGMFPLTIFGFAKAYQDGGYLDDAKQQIVRLIAKLAPPPTTDDEQAQNRRKNLARALESLATLEMAQERWKASEQVYHRLIDMYPEQAEFRVGLAVTLWRGGNKTEADKQFQKTLRIKPHDSALINRVAKAYLLLGHPEKAVPLCRRALQLKPDDALPQFDLAVALQSAGRTAEAIAQYQKHLADHPNALDAVNNLAWLYATYTDPQFRNGKEAVVLATRLCEKTKYQNPVCLDALSAAFAETGQFSRATSIAETAARLATATGREELAGQLKKRSDLYRQSKPYRESTVPLTNK